MTKAELRELRDNFEHVQTTTWITHSVGVWLVPLLIALFIPGNKLLWATGIATVMGWYFTFHREPMDKLKHQLAGDYDTPDEQFITPRVDRVGDTLGPAAVTLTYWAACLLSWLS